MMQSIRWGVVLLASALAAQASGFAQQTGRDKNKQAKNVKEQAQSEEQQLATGKQVYDAKCKMCHRADGKGTLEEMDLTDNTWKHGNTPEEIEKVIREGIKGTGMRALIGDHTDQEIKALVKYVVTFSANAPAAAAKPAEQPAAPAPQTPPTTSLPAESLTTGGGKSVSTDSKKEKAWEVFEFADLAAQREQSKRPYLEFLKVPTLRAGLYVLPVDAEDQQKPHTEDEVYYVASGRAIIQIGDETRPVQPGSVIFVKAGVQHRFHSIKEELRILVFFSSASGENPRAKE